MADAELLEREKAQLRAAIDALTHSRLQTHMRNALQVFDALEPVPGGTDGAVSTQDRRDAEDPLAITLRANQVMVKAPRDALFLAVHGLMMDLGFTVVKDADTAPPSTGNTLPSNWDANSVNGLFTVTYIHPNDPTITFNMQALFVGHKFEVYLSDNHAHTHSIELSVTDHVMAGAPSESPILAATVLRHVAALRALYTAFIANIVPKKPQPPAAVLHIQPPSPPRSPPTYEQPSPLFIPPVGRGDILPPGLGGGDPGMLVGPDHAIFGQRPHPGQGPVPGARFDPFGPVGGEPFGPGGGSFGPRIPASSPMGGPSAPFGMPNPDHLRMPRDDQMDDPFRGGGGGGRSSGHDSFRPFGSDHSFF